MSDESDSPAPDDPRPPKGGGGGESSRGRMGYLYQQYSFLETLVALTISALILMSLGLNLFLFKQMRLVRAQLGAQKKVSSALLDEFHNKREPAIQSFVTALQGYAETNPDFRPILEHYRPRLAQYFTTSDGPGTAPVSGAE